MIKKLRCCCDGTWSYERGRTIAEVEGTVVYLTPYTSFFYLDELQEDVKTVFEGGHYDLAKLNIAKKLPRVHAGCRNCGRHFWVSYEPGEGIRCAIIEGHFIDALRNF